MLRGSAVAGAEVQAQVAKHFPTSCFSPGPPGCHGQAALARQAVAQLPGVLLDSRVEASKEEQIHIHVLRDATPVPIIEGGEKYPEVLYHF